MLVQLRRALVASAIFFVLFGLAYPAIETGISQVLFHSSANGSVTPNGSTLLGQVWSGPTWFHGRPDTENPEATGASNLGPNSKVLSGDVAKEIATLKRLGIEHPTADLVTTSGSGVDPDITPAGAYAQVAMVAKARKLTVSSVNALVARQIHGKQLGFLGSSYINVLQLNEALASMR